MQNFIERKWMVKSNSKILGPYSLEQVEDLIKKKQLTLIDEIRDMENRWLYVRECEALQSTVEQLRKEITNSDDYTKTFQTRTVQTSSTSTQNMTQVTITQEHTKENSSKKELTSEQQNELKSEKEIAIVSESPPRPEIQDVVFSEIKKPSTSDYKKTPITHYVSEGDPRVRASINQKSSNIFITLLMLLVLVLGGGAGYYFYKQQNQKKYEQSVLATVRKYSLFGLDNKIIELYAKISPALQQQVLPEIIPLIPKLDEVGLISGAQTIGQLRTYKSVSSSKKALLDTVEFNQALHEQNFKKAREFLISALDADPTNDLIKENNAILSFYEKDYSKAMQIFSQLFQATNKGRLLYGELLSYVQSGENNLNTENNLMREVDRYIIPRVDYRKELLLANMYFSKKNAMEKEFLNNKKLFLNTPVGLSKLFQTPFVVYSSFYNYNHIKTIFEKLRPYLSSQDIALLEPYIKLELDEIASAQNIFEASQGMYTLPEKADLQMQINLALKNYNAILAQEKTLSQASLSVPTHLALMLAKIRT
ncbi:MAG: hypothetical protein ACK41T_06925, partial [Pseudobdellovibrio sp.]